MVPVLMSAQVWLGAVTTLVTLARKPVPVTAFTRTGRGANCWVPLPSTPNWLSPQQRSRAVGLDGARVVLGDRDVDLPGEGGVAGAVQHRVREQVLDVGAVTELVVAVVAPAVDAAAGEAGARVVLAGGDLRDTGERTGTGDCSSRRRERRLVPVVPLPSWP